MASFVDGKNNFPEALKRYVGFFDRHVVAGRMARVDHFSEPVRNGSYTSHRILFALPGEEWRMQAMIDLMTGDGPWSPEHERRQGELLGYKDWMNDYWLEFVFGNKRPEFDPIC